MNSKLRDIIVKHTSEMLDSPNEYEIYPTTKFYNNLEKAIRQAVGEEMLELTEEQYERSYIRGDNDPVYVELVKLRQKIKERTER